MGISNQSPQLFTRPMQSILISSASHFSPTTFFHRKYSAYPTGGSAQGHDPDSIAFSHGCCAERYKSNAARAFSSCFVQFVNKVKCRKDQTRGRTGCSYPRPMLRPIKRWTRTCNGGVASPHPRPLRNGTNAATSRVLTVGWLMHRT